MTPGDFIEADWPAPPGVVAGITTRRGGMSRGAYRSMNLGLHVGDAAESVRANRQALAATLGLAAEPSWLAQVHGNTVIEAPFAETAPQADASWTGSAGVVCVVLVADCLPVLLARRDGSRVAAAHAGWRGLAAGVIEETVGALRSAPEDLVAWLGPAISGSAFEVGGEVREAFVETDPAAAAAFETNARGRWQADLYALARQRLARLGVTAVHGGGYCTYADSERFFSYRRDGRCGRMAALIFRRPEAPGA